jgi:hypothetical protein
VGQSADDIEGRAVVVPPIGARIARTVGGIAVEGLVQYSDELQVLVKWDDGRSSSLRVGREPFRIMTVARNATGAAVGQDSRADAAA